MIKKTKLTAALLTAAMVLQLAACGSNAASGTENTSDNGATAATETTAASESAESVDTETAATEDTGTHTVVDHAGNTVEVPNHITRVVIDQIPILSTYMSYFGGEAPYIVGYCGSFKDTISKTVLKNIAPELMESADTVYAQSDLNIEEIMKLEPDVILYNAGNTAHAEILQESGIPCIGFATVGHETEADPLNRYKQWLDLLEDVFGDATFTQENGLRGSYVLKAENPLGPFEPYSDGALTPEEWECLDATLYVSKSGEPYLVFCHEHTQIIDGEICFIKLNKELNAAISLPTRLFAASSPYWADKKPKGEHYITDGPFMYRTKEGKLLLIWSTFVNHKYCQCVARSSDNELNGVFEHLPLLIDNDGGHGMIFKAEDKLYLSYHTPNTNGLEHPKFTLIKDNGKSIELV